MGSSSNGFEGCQWLCVTETTIKDPMTSDSGMVEKNSIIPDFKFLSTCLLSFALFLRIIELLDVTLKPIKIKERKPHRNFNPKIKNRST